MPFSHVIKWHPSCIKKLSNRESFDQFLDRKLFTSHIDASCMSLRVLLVSFFYFLFFLVNYLLWPFPIPENPSGEKAKRKIKIVSLESVIHIIDTELDRLLRFTPDSCPFWYKHVSVLLGWWIESNRVVHIANRMILTTRASCVISNKLPVNKSQVCLYALRFQQSCSLYSLNKRQTSHKPIK